MGFGFGFNKAKVLASAEKFVQQGKLQNAIGEYEKIIKEDPKDLTVLNTIGDLCARVGQNDHAAHYFKKAGDQYAHDGFTVKAIAVFKKLSRLNPGDIESVNKLADLYTQQGLVSDARSQYMQVADHLLKTGDNSGGARVLQRILELDPENTATKSKLADLYIKLGKKEEARNIYYTAAESLYTRGSFQAAEEALERLLKMDPQNGGALLLRGMIAADSGDGAAAIEYLEHVPDLDSRPDALRALVRAKVQSNSAPGLETLAGKLLTKYDDTSGIHEVAGWYINNNQAIKALRLYESHSGKLMSADKGSFQQTLHAWIEKIRDNAEALNVMMHLLEKADDSTHAAELMELQAHASAQKGRFQEAKDLYQKLSNMEPDNALHQQNFKQMQTKLGEDSASRSLSPEEAQQAFMVEALEEEAPVVHETYDPAVEKAIEAALTDAELYVSYNVPAKAVPPLEAVLPMAPRDVTINQRLATLYARAGRFADAARTCETLSEIYREKGHEKEAAQYLDAAQSYALRAPKGSVTLARAVAAAAETVSETQPATVEIDLPLEQGAPSVQEFSFDVPDHLGDAEPAGTAAPAVMEPAPVQEIKLEEVVEAQLTPEASTISVPRAHEGEEDVSNEWEDMLTVEGEAAAVEIPASAQSVQHAPSQDTSQETPADAATEKIKEIQFYISQEMWDLAKKSILDLTEIAPDHSEITTLISSVTAGQSRGTTAKPATAAYSVSEFEIQPEATPQPPSPPPAKAQPAAAAAPVPAQAPEFTIAPVRVDTQPETKTEEVRLETVLEEPKPAPPKPKKTAAPPPPAEKPMPEPIKPAAIREPEPVLEESSLEEILDVAPPPLAKKEEPKPAAKKPILEKTTEDILSDFVGDLEKNELVDFAPKPKQEPAKPAPAPKVAAPPPPAVAPPAPIAPPVAHVQGSTNGNSVRDAEANSMLTDILAELQEENVESSERDSDPETHYNLGIAFKEMGLLDEAIGELQKVCHAVDRGNPFSQPIQAYTWLAQCLVDKGAPEAAVRWYQRALKLSGLDDSSRCAIYYDLAAAYEASGDDKSALANFMEVYGSNIDFRDVASRIKALKS